MSIYSFCVIMSLMFIMVTLLFIKRRLIDIRYSLLWIFISFAMLLISLNKNIIEYFSLAMNVNYAPSLLFLIGILFCFLLILNMTIIISNMQRSITRLTQEIGILKSEGNRLDK